MCRTVGKTECKVNRKRERFMLKLLALSEAETREEAIEEWVIEDVADCKSYSQCLCGTVIGERWLLRNTKNGNQVNVGNECVLLFWKVSGVDLGRLARCVRSDLTKPLCPKLINEAAERGWIEEAQRDAYILNWRRRSRLSLEQRNLRVVVNQIILMKMGLVKLPEAA